MSRGDTKSSLLEFTKTYLNNLILETKGAVTGKRLPKTQNGGWPEDEDEMRWKTV